jgi:hypothetical protein
MVYVVQALHVMEHVSFDYTGQLGKCLDI